MCFAMLLRMHINLCGSAQKKVSNFSVSCNNIDQIGVDADRAVHVGDDEQADRTGANAVGIDCW